MSETTDMICVNCRKPRSLHKETAAGRLRCPVHSDDCWFKDSGRPSRYTPNVEQIRAEATRVVVGRVPLSVRRELSAAVKAGYLGRLPKKGLKPEIYFHPDHYCGAVERQQREEAHALQCIASVATTPAMVRAGIEGMGGDVLEYARSERVAKR